MREIQIGEPVDSKRRLYFHLVGTDGITPSTTEAGGQPQISIDGGAWANGGIGTLSAIGNGRYYADLAVGIADTVGRVIETRFKSATTAECPGDSAVVVTAESLVSATGDGGPVLSDEPILATIHRGITRDIVLRDAADETIVLLTADKIRAYIGRESEITDDLSAGTVFLVTSDAATAAGSNFTKNSPSSGYNRLRIDAGDMTFDPGIYELFIDFYDSADSNEWKAVDRISFVLEQT